MPIFKALAELGYVEGRNLAVEWRCFEMDFSRAPPMAAELMRLRIDVFWTAGTPQTKALQDATKTIPIVTSMNDPVASGFAPSLARPAGNVTGLVNHHPDLAAMQVELIRRIVPGLDRIVFIEDVRYTSLPDLLRPYEIAAKAAGLTTQVRMVDRSGFEAVFREMERAGARAALIYSPDIDLPEVARLAIRYRVATMVGNEPGYVDSGGLVAYNMVHENFLQRTAVIIAKIMKGTKPGDIPWELPDRTFLGINLRTAKALALAVPGDVLLRANKVVE